MLEGRSIAYLGRADLVANKRATARAQDFADLSPCSNIRRTNDELDRTHNGPDNDRLNTPPPIRTGRLSHLSCFTCPYRVDELTRAGAASLETLRCVSM